MPGKSRGFGGNLLGGTVRPIPDDDEPTPAPTTTPEPAPAPPAQAEATQQAAPAPRPRAVPDPEPEPTPVSESSRARKGPPATIRLNGTAGEALWQAYLEAKARDHFLSYRQFASDVVMDGLIRQKRRR
jgi:hypothetical protein